MALVATRTDLTTTAAPFVEQARGRGDLFIQQPYELYSERNQTAWRRLCRNLRPLWQRHASDAFLHGLESLRIDLSRIPRLHDVNAFLAPLTGFRCRPVAGYVPSYLFFECLRRREFPTTITVRSPDRLDYLPEPDIFHDVAGHVPMHTDPVFADTLVKFGDVAHAAALRARDARDPDERVRLLDSIVRGMARFFWFTVEFGLMRRPHGGLCAYGSGILSSREEIEHALVSTRVQRSAFQIEWVIHQAFEIDHLQPLLFYIDSFEQLLDEVDRLQRWVIEGRLDDTAPGAPHASPEDLRSFLAAVDD